ncbi:MAG TPA: hypothetical protein VKH45_14595 [Candidatus Acidoferrum sp.]|nr:hypothetical protein [Candidatus Acidoferrum sp.]
MSVDTIIEQQRGVHCRNCGKPVRVPALVARNEHAAHLQDTNNIEYHLISKVFVLRCHWCRKESIYSMNQIVDISYVPKHTSGMTKEAVV